MVSTVLGNQDESSRLEARMGPWEAKTDLCPGVREHPTDASFREFNPNPELATYWSTGSSHKVKINQTIIN